MRWRALLRKALLESVRDWKILILAVTFAPFFVVLMYGYFRAGTTVYRIAVVNRDAGPRGAALVAALRLAPPASGKESVSRDFSSI